MGSDFINYLLGQDLPQYHPPKADKSAGATGQAGYTGFFGVVLIFRMKMSTHNPLTRNKTKIPLI